MKSNSLVLNCNTLIVSDLLPIANKDVMRLYNFFFKLGLEIPLKILKVSRFQNLPTHGEACFHFLFWFVADKMLNVVTHNEEQDLKM